MDKSNISRRGLTILSIYIVLAIGVIITGVVIWQEGKKSDRQEKDQSYINSDNDLTEYLSSSDVLFTASATLSAESTGTSTVFSEISATSKVSEISSTIIRTTNSAISSTTARAITTTATAASSASSSCVNPKMRKEWRDLSEKEQSDFLEAVNEMFRKPSRKGYENLQMDFVKTHIDHKTAIHNSTIFLLWHRQFIFQYEKELQAINPSITLPYWDWGMDYDDPANSPLFEDDAFGGTGDSSTNCITNGKFAGIQTQFYERETSPHCVKRDFGGTGNITTLPPPSLMMGYSLFNDFNTFSHAFESYPHALAHNFLGGDMITNQSPSDPMFFLVHANVDRYFLIWQNEHPEVEYPGNLEDRLPEYEISLSVAFQSPKETSDYCYTYSSTNTLNKRKKDISSPKKEGKRKINYPSRVPSKFTKMMGGDPTNVRKLEDASMKFIDCLNDVEFDSPAASYAADRKWRSHNIKHGASRFEKSSNSRKQLEKCLSILEEK